MEIVLQLLPQIAAAGERKHGLRGPSGTRLVYQCEAVGLRPFFPPRMLLTP